MANLTTTYKILKALMSNEVKSPKDLYMEIDREPGTIRNTLPRLKRMGMIKQPDYGKYVITDFGREYFKRISQPSTLQDSKEGEKS